MSQYRQIRQIWQKSKRISKIVASDPLMSNSFFIALSRAANKGVGLLFWSVAARYYTIADVGLATALISSLELIMTLSRFGSDVSLIRFMPLRDKEAVFNTSLWISAALSLAISLVYISTIDILSPDLTFLKKYIIYFIIIVLAHSATLTIGYAMISQRWGKAYLGQSLALSSRVPLLLIMGGFGCMGIFFSLGAAYLIVLAVSIIQVSRMVHVRLKVDRRFLEDTLRFSSCNYLGSVLNAAPALILPLMILNLLGPAEAARWYVAFSAANLIMIIPDAVSTSFFVEGSYGTNISRAIARMMALAFGLLLFPVLVICIWGRTLLGLLGPEYLSSTDLLTVLALASFPVTIYSLYIPILNLRDRAEIVALMSLSRFVLLLGSGYILIGRYGIIGAGYAWMLTYALLCLTVAYEAFGRHGKPGQVGSL